MSPELIEIRDGFGKGEFNPELADMFSLGMSLLRISLQLVNIWWINILDKWLI